MRTIPAAFDAHLKTGVTTTCWCWLIIREDGVRLGLTNHDRDLTFGGDTYEAGTGMLASEIQSKLGLAVDNMEIEGGIDSEQVTDTDLAAGRYDFADIIVYKVNWQDTDQRIVLKKGTLGEAKRGRTFFSAELRGLSAQLQQEQGLSYQRTCGVALGSAKCGVDLTDARYKADATVTATDGFSALTATLHGFITNWFSTGEITFTSGNNAGVKVEVRSHKAGAPASVELWAPAPFAISAGDSFTITAGCVKTLPVCHGKFDNTNRYRGFWHIPNPDFLLSIANSDDSRDHDGDSLTPEDVFDQLNPFS